ncbi:MAG TPA: hypothetical protein VN675_10150 [Burkholderiales bacterium]|nr:hypothetical protein [Burkholderiales bacterium]
MKTILPKFATLADWVSATWPLLTGRPNPVKIPKPAQPAADHRWEGEGGALRPAKAAPAAAPKTPA